MKKKKNGAKVLIIILAVFLLLTAAVVYFGFINNKTAIPIREYIASKLIEKGKTSQAETLYYDILTRDETNEGAYLALADIYIKDKDYEEAHDILDEGLGAAPSQTLADKQWNVYEKEANLVEADGDDKALLAFINSIPAEELLSYYDDKSDADKYAEDDAKRWLDATLAIAKTHMQHGDAAGAQRILEDALNDPLNEFVDKDAINEALIPVYLALGEQAIAASDNGSSARYFFNKVLELDPTNKDALDGLARLEQAEIRDLWKLVDIDAVIKAELGVNYHGLRLTVPVDMVVDAVYDGRNNGRETFNIDETVTLSVLGQKQTESQSIRAYQDRKDMVLESDLTGTQREPDASLKDTVFAFIADYHALISAAPFDGTTQTVNGVKCNVSHATMKGKDYLYFVPKNTLPQGTDDFMKTLTLDVTRYTAVDDGRVIRVEATMVEADADALNALLLQFIGSINADVSINSMKVTIDVDAK